MAYICMLVDMWRSIAYIGCRDAGMGWGRLGLWGTGSGAGAHDHEAEPRCTKCRSRRLDKFIQFNFSITEEGIPTPQNTESFGTDPRAGGLSRFTFSARRRGREAGTSPKPRARDSERPRVRETRKVSPPGTGAGTGTGTGTGRSRYIHTLNQDGTYTRPVAVRLQEMSVAATPAASSESAPA